MLAYTTGLQNFECRSNATLESVQAAARGTDSGSSNASIISLNGLLGQHQSQQVQHRRRILRHLHMLSDEHLQYPIAQYILQHLCVTHIVEYKLFFVDCHDGVASYNYTTELLHTTARFTVLHYLALESSIESNYNELPAG